jgi:hypothetical protein
MINLYMRLTLFFVMHFFKINTNPSKCYWEKSNSLSCRKIVFHLQYVTFWFNICCFIFKKYFKTKYKQIFISRCMITYEGRINNSKDILNLKQEVNSMINFKIYLHENLSQRYSDTWCSYDSINTSDFFDRD